MKFPFRIYYRTFVISIILLIVVLVIMVLDILSLTNVIPIKTMPTVADMVFHILVIILIPLVSITALFKSYSMAKEKEADAVKTQGVISDIIKPREIGRAGKYRLNGRFVQAKYIVIGDIKYYCMCADGLEIGMSVEIKYLPTSKYVLEIERI